MLPDNPSLPSKSLRRSGRGAQTLVSSRLAGRLPGYLLIIIDEVIARGYSFIAFQKRQCIDFVNLFFRQSGTGYLRYRRQQIQVGQQFIAHPSCRHFTGPTNPQRNPIAALKRSRFTFAQPTCRTGMVAKVSPGPIVAYEYKQRFPGIDLYFLK